MEQSLDITPSPLIAIDNEPEPILTVDAPLAGPLSAEKVFIQYRVNNIRIMPVFGAGAMEVSPRRGHLHITVDEAPWHFIDGSGETVVVVGLAPGGHRIRFDLANPMHQDIATRTIRFTVPG